MIRINNATLIYQDKVLFENLSVSFAIQQWSCILGPSGVGKTTLIRLIAGLSDYAGGTVSCDDGIAIPPRIAYLSQDDCLLPWLSALDNVLIGMRLRGILSKDAIKKAKHLLDAVGLSKAIDLKPKQLSGGMRQRVTLARTLLEDRDIVLMDEPFSALDAITRLRLQDLAAELLKNKTVILVTHDPLEALRLGQHIYVMSGRPATLGEALVPTGNIPRPLDDQKLLQLQAELLQRLSNAQELEQ